MASFHPNGTYGSHWWGDVTPSVNWQNISTNQSSLHVRLVMRADSGYSQNATTSYNVRINGGAIGSGSRTVALNGNSGVLIDADVTVNHDANGNWSGSYGGSFSSSYSGVGSGGADWAWSITRLPLAPTIYGNTVDNIKQKSVRIGSELSSLGHGTSAAGRIYYREYGVGSYISAGDQADASGWNYWTISGLKPGKTYQYYSYWWNNNGDPAQSAVGTFKTKPAVGLTPLLLELT